MIVQKERFQAIPKTLGAALLLTGGTKSAGAAVLVGIAGSSLHQVSGNGVFPGTAKAAIQRRADLEDQSELPFPILPFELRRLISLAPKYRDSFALRVLIGLTPDLCSRVLHLPIHEAGNAIYTAVQELPRIETCDMKRRELSIQPMDAKAGAYTSSTGVNTWLPTR
jgi:hypothetical protein